MRLEKLIIELKSSKGISFVELAIAAVVAAILLGLILSSNKIIESAQVREVVSSEEKRESGEQLFITKYNAKPGDFRRATTLLSAAGLPGGVNLVNGDGDGIVEDSGLMIQETVQYAVHLKAAGLYDEDSDLTTGCMNIKQRFGNENTCLRMRFTVNIPGITGGIQHTNISAFASGSPLPRPAVPGDAARAIDLKMGDDGLPNFDATARAHRVFVPDPEIKVVEENAICGVINPAEYSFGDNLCATTLALQIESAVPLAGGAGGIGGGGGSGGCPGGLIVNGPGADCTDLCDVCDTGLTCCSGTCQSTCSGGAGGSSGGSGGSSGGSGGSSGGSGGSSGGSGGSSGGSGGSSGGSGGSSGGSGGSSGGSGGGPGPGPGTGGGGIGGAVGGFGGFSGGGGGLAACSAARGGFCNSQADCCEGTCTNNTCVLYHGNCAGTCYQCAFPPDFCSHPTGYNRYSSCPPTSFPTIPPDAPYSREEGLFAYACCCAQTGSCGGDSGIPNCP